MVCRHTSLLLLLVVVVAITALPQPPVSKSPSLIRSKIITKHDLVSNNNRQQKSHKLPAPFVVSTQLNVKDPTAATDDAFTSDGGRKRKSRTWRDPNDGATVVEGLRVPDDESDRVTFRNGRFINNVFVPNNDGDNGGKQPKGPARREGRDYKYHAGATQTGRPVYYVVEEPDSLHSDHSPYTYEPADTQTSLVSDYTQQGLAQQGPGDFVIKEHTYSMCPGCPTFSIPVPIPKDQATSASSQHQQLNYEYPSHQQDAARNLTFLEKVGNSLQDLQHQAKRLLVDPVVRAKDRVLGVDSSKQQQKEEGINEKHDYNVGEGQQLQEKEQTGTSPLALAGLGALAVGGMALVSTAITLARVGSAPVTSVEGRSLLQQNPALLEFARRNHEMFAELSWDQECIFEALCKEALVSSSPTIPTTTAATKSDRRGGGDDDVKDFDVIDMGEMMMPTSGEDEALNLMNKLVRQTCGNRKRSEIPETQRCRMLRNEHRRTRNHRNIDNE